MMQYKPFIDGLRAVSVLAVIGYHFYPAVLHGGFVGVDVFFVISGYLITNIILYELSRQDFTIRHFYIRRIRRIFPALLLTLLTALALGWFFLDAVDYKELSIEVIAGLLFSSNFLFLFQSGYFDSSALAKPMLHLWSLGVEEQFYIFYPLLLVFFHRRHQKAGSAIGLFFMVSMLLNLLVMNLWPQADFYLPMTRFWELSSGGLVAWYQFNRSSSSIENSSTGANFAAIFGVLLLLVSFVKISDAVHFPGLHALLPVAGASLIIWGGQNCAVNRNLLGNRLLTWIGAISYPLYLWHWVLLSIATITNSGVHIESHLKFKLIVASFILAWATHRWIERPIKRATQPSKVAIRLLLLASTALLLSLAIFAADGFKSRAIKNYTEKQLIDIHRNPLAENCLTRFFVRHGIGKPEKCATNSDHPEVVMIGDSHAGHYFWGLVKSNLKIADIWNGGCYPGAHFSEKCRSLNHHVHEYLEREKSIRVVLLAMQPERYVSELGEGWLNALAADYRAEIFKLQALNVHVGLLLDVPGSSEDTRICFATGSCVHALPLNEVLSRTTASRQMLLKLAGEFNLPVFDPHSTLCDQHHCRNFHEGKFIYWDGHHLNEHGSELMKSPLSRWIDATFELGQ